MRTQLKEVERGSGTSILYPGVSSCLTVSCVCRGIIYGIHGVQVPKQGQKSIDELLSWLKSVTRSHRRDRLIIACDLNFWANNGGGIQQFGHPDATNFDTLADYLQVNRQGAINGAGVYGACTVVDVGNGSPYFRNNTQSAYFTVGPAGQVNPT